MKRTVAFFDIDGTIFRDSLMIAHFRKMRELQIINDYMWNNNIDFSEARWAKRRVNYDDFLNDISSAYIESLKGVPYEDVLFSARQTIKSRADEVYRFTKERITFHKKNNHMVIFISGSPHFLVDHMAKIWKADLAFGSVYKFKDDVFTGEIVPMWDSKSKLGTISRLVEEYNINLEESFAYGDTNGDFTMLKSVGRPFAINPAKELLDNIDADDELRKKATIVVERKDVIYKLKSYVETFSSEDHIIEE